MFKRQAITDERIVHAQNKIYRELYNLIVAICVISMLVKAGNGLNSFAYLVVEISIIFGGGLYYLIRSARSGLYSEEVELQAKHNADKKYSVQSLVIGVIVGVVLGVAFGLNSALNYAEGTAESIKYFVLVFVTTIVFYTPVLFSLLFVPHMLAKKKSEQVNERMLEQDED